VAHQVFQVKVVLMETLNPEHQDLVVYQVYQVQVVNQVFQVSQV
jgi:hypothetical protein